MKYFIVGRSGTGKDTIAKQLSKELKLKVLVSYTDRPKRQKEKQNREHIFLHKREMDKILSTKEIFAYTDAPGYRYCSTVDQFNKCDIYIIDPEGIKDVERKNLDVEYKIIYLTLDKEIEKERALKRGDSEEVYLKRIADEDKTFSEFELSNKADLIVDTAKNNAYEIVKKFVQNYV